jgi:type VI protein secretion system component Hcp
LKLALALLTTSAFAFIAPIGVHAQTSVYINDGASPRCGTAAPPSYGGDFVANTFSFGGTSTPTTPPNPVYATLGALVITKALDTCSASLVTEFLSGQFIPTLKLIEVQLINNELVPVLTITLEEAQIISYQITETAGSKTSGEQISFGFETAMIQATPRDAAGKPGTPSTLIYDAGKNTVQ